MNGLLHSKVFKKNLYKWLIMYIGIIGLFFTVVTYSKYMSSMQGSSGTKAAKFIVNIKFLDNDTRCIDNTCNYGSLRPTSDYDFYFQVDTRELEVSTILATSITVDTRLTNIHIFDITDESNVKEITYNKTDNKYTIVDNIDQGNGSLKTYKVTANLDNTNNSLYDQEILINDAIKVEYSAVQVD